MKINNETNFNILTNQLYQNIVISTHNQYKNILIIYFIFLLSLQNSVHIFPTYSTSQFNIAMFQEFNNNV